MPHIRLKSKTGGNSSATNTLQGFKNDYEAEANGIALLQSYYLTDNNDYGMTPGTTRVRVYGTI
jgi:hypothetical protein